MLSAIASHPTWVCGLKRTFRGKKFDSVVTPYVGVWIETLLMAEYGRRHFVTPYVGVWIETDLWRLGSRTRYVTPYVGVWIETFLVNYYPTAASSHPTWVCGLKLKTA